MRKIAAVVAVLVAVCFTMGVAFAAGAPDKAISIKQIQKTKSPVAFNHGSHKDIDCAKCHHKGEKGKEVGCGTAKCHGDKAEGKKVDLKEAFHKQCKDCHKEMKKGPTKCDECHKK
jgi:hypothetical protein